ncbi:hypothetical protein HPB50_010468 [Hyalomma asiaticum]|uniref:Uncharacterized protein n=1 Tax=Hyalomma asiaticum TaxID=266040 RepID=A0ACB7T0W0_HYAAI|nr:hypothetical protein HPB50_010468 [Hyalomma asiaticum]
MSSVPRAITNDVLVRSNGKANSSDCPAPTFAATARLDGPAKMWYDSFQYVNKTWPEWKAELKRAFPTTAGMQRLHRRMEDRIYRAISTRTYDSPEELLQCLTVSRRARRNRWLAEFKPFEGE